MQLLNPLSLLVSPSSIHYILMCILTLQEINKVHLLRCITVLVVLLISVESFGLTQCSGFIFHNDQASQWLAGLDGQSLFTHHRTRLPSLNECRQLVLSSEAVLMHSSEAEQLQAVQYCTGLTALVSSKPAAQKSNCFIADSVNDLELLPEGHNVVLMSGQKSQWGLNHEVVYRGNSLTLVGQLTTKRSSTLSLLEHANLKPCTGCQTDLILTSLTLNLSEHARLFFNSNLHFTGAKVNGRGGKLVASRDQTVSVTLSHSHLNRYSAYFLDAPNLRSLSILHSDILDSSITNTSLFDTTGTNITLYNNQLIRPSGMPPALLLTAGFGSLTFRHNDLNGPWQIDLEDNVSLGISIDNRVHLSQVSNLDSYQAQFNLSNEAGTIPLARYTDVRQRRQATEVLPTNSTMGDNEDSSSPNLAIALPVGLVGGIVLFCGMTCYPCILAQCLSETYRDIYQSRKYQLSSPVHTENLPFNTNEADSDSNYQLVPTNTVTTRCIAPFIWYFKIWAYSFFATIKMKLFKH